MGAGIRVGLIYGPRHMTDVGTVGIPLAKTMAAGASCLGLLPIEKTNTPVYPLASLSINRSCNLLSI